MSIADVDFGRLDAEAEEHLLEYFVDTDVVGRIASGARQYVVGRKGSGKTALFRRLDGRLLGRPVQRLEFVDYSWEAHKRLREEGVPEEFSYVASWRFTLLMTMVLHWSESAKRKLKRESIEMVRSLYGEDMPQWHRLLFDRFRRLRRLDLPELSGVGSLGGFELESKAEGPVLAASVANFSRKLLHFVQEHYGAAPVTLLLDRLDDGWDASEESKQLLAGAIKAARELNLALKRSNEPAAVVIFLRTDIYQSLHFNDKNKIGIDIEYLDWTEDSLIEVASARIARSLDCQVAAAWDKAFSSDRMRQRATIRSYIVKRTMLRPRDLIAYCIQCKEAAIASGHDVVQTEDVYDAEVPYSHHVYSELDDEMHKQLPRARESIQVLRDIQQQRFTLNEWLTALRARHADASDAEAIARLKELFDYSVVGVPKVGGRTGGTKFQFVYEDRLLQPNFNAQMVVHFSLKKALTLRDRGA